MPTYQYACSDCGHDFEAKQSFSDDTLTECPVCHGRLRKVFNSVGIVFKGSGFYRTDSREKAGSGSGASGSKGKGGDGAKGDSAKDSGGSKDSGGGKSDSGKSDSAKAGSSAGSGGSSGSSSSGSSSTAGSAA